MTPGPVVSRHEPYEQCGSGVPVGRLEATATPGERVALSFDVTAAAAGPVTVHPVGPASAWLDAWIVKVWDQAGVGVYRGPRMPVPELLVKDDGDDPVDGYTPFCGHLRHLHRLRHRPHYYRPPALRLTGPATTANAVPGQPAQVWVTATVPLDAAPGTHVAGVHVVAAGGAAADVAVSVTVLPLRLREPRQERFLWYRGTLDCRRPQHRVPEDVFRAQLADIRAHGFTGVSLNETDPALLRRAVRLARDAGLSGPVVLHAPHPGGVAAGVRPLVYVSDEVDQHGPSSYDSHRRNMVAAAELGLPTMASIVDGGFLPRLAELAPLPGVVSVYLPASRRFVHESTTTPALRHGVKLLYYWPAHMEKPNVHRVLAGLYLWNSGAAGIAPYCYQHLPVFPNSPYDDFDDWEPGYRLGGEGHDYKDHMATYPARTGAAPTLQWEGLGEGITDLRYVTTVEALLGEAVAVAGAQAAACRESQATLDEIAATITLPDVEIASETATEPYPHLTATDLARFRARLAAHALALQSISARS